MPDDLDKLLAEVKAEYAGTSATPTGAPDATLRPLHPSSSTELSRRTEATRRADAVGNTGTATALEGRALPEDEPLSAPHRALLADLAGEYSERDRGEARARDAETQAREDEARARELASTQRERAEQARHERLEAEERLRKAQVEAQERQLRERIEREEDARRLAREQAEQQRRATEEREERLRQEQDYARRVREAQAWLSQLRVDSDEGRWFEEFATSHPSRLIAAIEYLHEMSQR